MQEKTHAQIYSLFQTCTHTHTHTRCPVPSHWSPDMSQVSSRKCAEMRTHTTECQRLRSFAGRRVLTTQPSPPHPQPIKNASCHTSSERGRNVAARQCLSWTPPCVCTCVYVCVCTCAWVSAGLVIFHWSPLSVVDKHEPLLKQRVVGGEHLGPDLFMAHAEPLNLRGFRMENSILFCFLVDTVLCVQGPLPWMRTCPGLWYGFLNTCLCFFGLLVEASRWRSSWFSHWQTESLV